jgi:hypothetical protein
MTENAGIAMEAGNSSHSLGLTRSYERSRVGRTTATSQSMSVWRLFATYLKRAVRYLTISSEWLAGHCEYRARTENDQERTSQSYFFSTSCAFP